MYVLVLTLLAGCGLDPSRVPEQPVFAGDRQVVTRAGPIRFAVVGATGDDSGPVIADITAAVRGDDLAFVVLLGDQIRRSSARSWQRMSDLWAPVTAAGASLVPLVGAGERRGDEELVGFSAAYGLGGWWWFDLVVDDHPWRLVLLESDEQAMGKRWAEQQYGLPRAVAEDRSLLLFLPTPALVASAAPDRDAARLVEAVDDHAPPGAVSVVFQGGVPTHELHLPGARWGEAVVLAGNSGVPGVQPGSSELSGVLDPLVDPADAVDADAIAVQGWWLVELHGREIDLAFRMRHDDGSLRPIARIHHEPAAGWQRVAVETHDNDPGER